VTVTEETTTRPLAEGLVEIDGEELYRVPDVDRMPPFLMSVVSDGDRWMFVSSVGPLTAGRGDVRAALFPYETDDRLHHAVGTIGPVTRLRVATRDGDVRWRPFTDAARPPVRRALAKSVTGDSVVFEERHEGIGLTFRYRWSSTEQHGFVRTASLVNDGPEPVRIEVLDGLVGLLPHGLDPTVYQRLSNLSNAYKRSELIDHDTRLAVYSLESPVSDSAEPEEVLRATAAWSIGLDGASVTLDPSAVRAFDDGDVVQAATLVTGRPGAYLLRGAVELVPGASTSWRIVADVALDQFDVVALGRSLVSSTDDAAWTGIDQAIRSNAEQLQRMMARADAQQCTADRVACAHHVANVTYNVMRGGVPLSGYRIDTADFADFVATRNRPLGERHASWFAQLAPSVDRRALLAEIEVLGDAHLLRLGREYLPFSFSRRHGDPSRPWNAFSIRVTDDAGDPIVHYEGNWRDVFQNWEALCASFPEYLPGVVVLFANASTADGHNPYRIARDGIDWEVPDPDDPWANIGYWGDHQVVYLLRLLEATDRYLPGEVLRLLDERCCTYADVPYRIAGFDAMVRDPKATIHFDVDADARAQERAGEIGGDGKLLPGPDGDPALVTLLEKLLVTALAKLSNFVPGGGIWMNTQRPEWNDANNALVGYGLSMVTACHLRRFLGHLRTMVTAKGADAVVSAEVATWLAHVAAALREAPLEVADDDAGRFALMGRLGRAATDYRTAVYDAGLSGATSTVDAATIVELLDTAIGHLDATIRGSRRSDGLVHAYNLVELAPDGAGASIRRLPEMLEGQVAVLGSGVLTPTERADLLDALFESSLHRADQDSFLLAPIRHLPAFVDKNVIPVGDVEADPLLAGLLAAGDTSLVRRDADGRVRFHPELTDEAELTAALDRLAATDDWAELVAEHRRSVLDTYERVFEHRAFVGRSGSMYAYEGIGSIYWHMVTKLLLAVQEAASEAADEGADAATVARLATAYDRVRAGLGFNKSAVEFGAIPIDPYSHTPAHAGAQQPGMTGAVKEELLARPRELGVRVVDGELAFDTLVLRRSELLDRPTRWQLYDVSDERVELDLEPGAFGMTVCQVPVVIGLAPGTGHVEAHLRDGRTVRHEGLRLGRELSAALFGRTGEIERIDAALPADAAT
jgi:hypothetical protein